VGHGRLLLWVELPFSRSSGCIIVGTREKHIPPPLLLFLRIAVKNLTIAPLLVTLIALVLSLPSMKCEKCYFCGRSPLISAEYYPNRLRTWRGFLGGSLGLGSPSSCVCGFTGPSRAGGSPKYGRSPHFPPPTRAVGCYLLPVGGSWS
jgi:hypothetical protein